MRRRRWIRSEIENVIGSDGFDESMVDYVIHADDVTLKKYISSLFEDETKASKFCEKFRRYDVSKGTSFFILNSHTHISSIN